MVTLLSRFYQSGSIACLVTPIKARAGGSWEAVQRRHTCTLLQRDNTINLRLHLQQANLVHALQHACQIWSMHSPRVDVANDTRAASCMALQRFV